MRPMGQFANWGKGSGGTRLSQSKEDPRNSPMPRNSNSNRFSSLYSTERSVSPSGQPLSGNFDRQGSSGSQSPTSTLDRQHRAGSSGSRSMGPMGKWTNRGTHDSSSERDRMLQPPRQHMTGSNAYEQTNFAKNGPQMIGLISRKPPSVNGPSEEEIKEGQQRMEGKQVTKHGNCGEDFERSIKNILDEFSFIVSLT